MISKPEIEHGLVLQVPSHKNIDKYFASFTTMNAKVHMATNLLREGSKQSPGKIIKGSVSQKNIKIRRTIIPNVVGTHIKKAKRPNPKLRLEMDLRNFGSPL